MGLARGIRQIAALGMVTGAALAGCGEERMFSAAEFVQEVKKQGVALRLGQQLQTSGGAEQLYAITLPPLRGEPAPAQAGGEHVREGGGGGSLYVYNEGGGASDQLEACRASAGLICFRASNVVVVLDEESGSLGAQRLAVAIGRLE